MENQTTKPFLSVANYHLIEHQLNKILNAYATTKDKGVILAVKGLVETELWTTLPASTIQGELIEKLLAITDRTQGDQYLESIQQYIIPFKKISDSSLKNLFKKEKKLKLPSLDKIDLYRTCYLSWDDLSSHRRYVVLEQDGKLKGIKGIFNTQTVKGVCSICQHHSNVSLFTTSVKGKTIGTFTNYSNYICTDSQLCNQNVTDNRKIIDFFHRITE